MAATHAPVSTLETLASRLASLPPVEGPFLTLYLDARPNEHGRDEIARFLRKELRARRRGLALSEEHAASYDDDVHRLESWVADVLPRSANGAALFACSAAGIFEAVAVEAPFPRHQFHVGPRPHLYPLLHLLDRYRRYAAVVADTQKTRVFVFGLGGRQDARDIEGDPKPRLEGTPTAENRYQRHVAEHYKQNLKEVASVLDALVRDERLEAVVLAGDEVVLPMLRAELSPAVASKVVDVMRLDIRTPEHEVLRATFESFLRHDAETDAEKVRRMFDEFRGGGLGVVGVGPTRLALEMGQVDELLLAADPAALRVTADDLEGLDAAAADALRAVTADELATRARQTAARVTFVEDRELLRDAGGVGALLRFRIAPRGTAGLTT